MYLAAEWVEAPQCGAMRQVLPTLLPKPGDGNRVALSGRGQAIMEAEFAVLLHRGSRFQASRCSGRGSNGMPRGLKEKKTSIAKENADSHHCHSDCGRAPVREKRMKQQVKTHDQDTLATAL